MLLQKRERGFFKAFRKKALLLVFLSFVKFSLFSQTTLSIQDFESPAATPTMGYTNTGGALYTGSSAVGDRPASEPFYTSAITAFGAQNTTATITFDNVTNLSSCVNKFFEFRLAAFSIGSTGNGMDTGDEVLVAVSLDGGATYSNEVRINGNSNAYWGYGATGLASAVYDGDNTPSPYQPGGGGNRTIDGYSTVRIDLPNAASQARLRITLLNNATAERWVIDDVKLVGECISCLPASEPTTNVSSIVATPTCYSADLSFTLGDGQNVMIVMSENCPISGSDPIDQTNYVANVIYGSGETIGAGNYVVYNGTGSSVTITGLSSGVTYCFKIYTYNGLYADCDENYLITGVSETSFTTNSTNCFGAGSCIKFNEFVFRPLEQDGRADDTGEWIELRNTCNCDVDLSCFVVCYVDVSSGARRGDCVTIPSGTILAAGELYLLGGFGTNCTGGTALCDWPGLSLDFNWHANASSVWDVDANTFYSTNVGNYICVATNSGEDISLYDNSGAFLDGITYDGGAGSSANNTENIPAVGACPSKSLTIPASSVHSNLGSVTTSDRGFTKQCDGSWTKKQTISTFSPGTYPEACATIACIILLSSDEIFLKGTNSKAKNELIWNVAPGLSVDYFIVEKSSDNINFEWLTEVSKENSSRYSVEDFNPFSTTYYRIAVIQKNGELAYSNTIVLSNSHSKGSFNITNIHPNPANTSFSFNFELLDRGTSVEFKMYNILGELILAQSLGSSQLVNLPSDGLDSGIYYLVFSNGSEQQSHKLLIQH